jgi:hypothetical protein
MVVVRSLPSGRDAWVISATMSLVRQSAATKFGPLGVHGRQAGLARVVDEGHPREINAEDRFALMGQGALPALL